MQTFYKRLIVTEEDLDSEVLEHFTKASADVYNASIYILKKDYDKKYWAEKARLKAEADVEIRKKTLLQRKGIGVSELEERVIRVPVMSKRQVARAVKDRIPGKIEILQDHSIQFAAGLAVKDFLKYIAKSRKGILVPLPKKKEALPYKFLITGSDDLFHKGILESPELRLKMRVDAGAIDCSVAIKITPLDDGKYGASLYLHSPDVKKEDRVHASTFEVRDRELVMRFFGEDAEMSVPLEEVWDFYHKSLVRGNRDLDRKEHGELLSLMQSKVNLLFHFAKAYGCAGISQKVNTKYPNVDGVLKKKTFAEYVKDDGRRLRLYTQRYVDWYIDLLLNRDKDVIRRLYLKTGVKADV